MSYFSELVGKLIHSFRMTAKNKENNCIWSMWVSNSNAICHEYEKHLSKSEIGEAVITARELFYAYHQNHYNLTYDSSLINGSVAQRQSARLISVISARLAHDGGSSPSAPTKNDLEHKDALVDIGYE